jgi:predicted ArsR family transcriptional regulator
MNGEQVIAAVLEATEMRRDEIRARTRKADVLLNRSVLVWALRNLAGLSYPAIGEVVARDHATVMAACQKIEALRFRDRVVEQLVETVCRSVAAEVPEREQTARVPELQIMVTSMGKAILDELAQPRTLPEVSRRIAGGRDLGHHLMRLRNAGLVRCVGQVDSDGGRPGKLWQASEVMASIGCVETQAEMSKRVEALVLDKLAGGVALNVDELAEMTGARRTIIKCVLARLHRRGDAEQPDGNGRGGALNPWQLTSQGEENGEAARDGLPRGIHGRRLTGREDESEAWT